MEAPTETDLTFNVLSSTYIDLCLKFTITSGSKLLICLSEIKSVYPKEYETELSLEELVKISKFFKCFDNVNETLPEIKNIIESKNYSICIQGNIALLYITPIKSFGESFIPLPMKKIDLKDVVNELCVSLDKMNKKQKNLILYISFINRNVLYELEPYNGEYIMNEEETNLVKQWISDSRSMQLILLYKAKVNSDSSYTFHQKCDGKSPTLTVIETTKGQKFGGYITVGRNSEREFKTDKNAFIFNLTTRKKFPIRSDGNYSIFDDKSYGPTFGNWEDNKAHAIHVYDNCFTHKSYCYSSKIYDIKAEDINGGEYEYIVKDYEVFYVSFE